MWTIFKVFIKLLQCCLCFGFLGMRYVGIFAPESGIEPSPHIGRRSLNYWITREAPISHFLEVFSCKQRFGTEACLNGLSDPSWAALLTHSPLHFFFFFVALERFVGSLFPDSELNLVPQQWKYGVLTTRPPGNSLPYSFIFFWIWTSPIFIGVLWSTRPCIVLRIQWWPKCELCGQRWNSYTGSFRSRLKS